MDVIKYYNLPLLLPYGLSIFGLLARPAWRTGEGDSDVVAHAPLPNMPSQPGGAPYHVWLEAAGMFLDVTTYQLREKGRQLDLLDGGHTSVEWCPDYLFAAKGTVSPFKDVAREHAGMYYYERVQALEKKFLGHHIRQIRRM